MPKESVDPLVPERAEAVGGGEDLAAAGVVEASGQIDQGEVGRLAPLRAAEAVMAAGADLGDRGGGDPVAFGARDGDRAVGAEAEAVGVPEAGGEGLDPPAVRRDPDQPLLAGGGVEPALAVALEAADEVVAGGRGQIGVADALVEVGLAVAVEVDQPGDLVATQDVDLPARDDQAEGVVEAGREPPPADVLQGRIQAGDMPDVPLHRADHGGAVGQEVVVAEEEEGLPGVLERRRDRVDRIRTGLAERAFGLDNLGTTGRAALRQGCERVAVGRGATTRRELAVLDPGGVEHLDPAEVVGEDDAVAAGGRSPDR